MGDEGVEADEEAFPTEGEDDEEAGADADGGNGLGAIGKAADHHGVDDGHAHPAEFGEDEWQGEPECGRQLGAEFKEISGGAGHGTSGRSVKGDKERSKFGEKKVHHRGHGEHRDRKEGRRKEGKTQAKRRRGRFRKLLKSRQGPSAA